MNNYINSRIQAHNNLKITNAIKHNLRHTHKSLSQLESNNFNYIFVDGKATKITKENKKELYTKISGEYKRDRFEHNEIYKKYNKRNLRETCGSWGEGVFTFSEQIKEDLKNKKYSLNDLSKVALDCLKDMEQHLGIKTKYMVLHLDEKTPHFQYFFTNFDNRGTSITFKNREAKDLSPLQDIAYKHFGKLGMERGVKKDFTNSSYMSAAKYWQTLGVDLKNKTISLEAKYNDKKQDIEKSLKALYTEVNLEKNNVKDLRDTHKRESEEYKSLTIEFKQLQQEEKLLRAKVRELKEVENLDSYLITLKEDLRAILKTNTKEVDPLIGAARVEVSDINKMYSQLFAKIKEPLNTKIVELKEQKELIATQAKAIALKDERIESITFEAKRLEKAFNINYKQLNTINQKLKRFQSSLRAISRLLKDKKINIMSLRAYLSSSRNISKKQIDDNTFSR